jgi:hypothetical protein
MLHRVPLEKPSKWNGSGFMGWGLLLIASNTAERRE